jgi:23S rRNA (cytidine2498-2'-O)-methyltransferase
MPAPASDHDSRSDTASAAPAPKAPFVFATCKSGWEKALKDEAKSVPEGLRPAFMRPGLITWKCEVPPTGDFVLPGIFARMSGHSIGTCKDAADLASKLGELKTRTLKLHVYPREVPEDGLPLDEWSRIDAFRTRLLKSLRDAGLAMDDDAESILGDTVLDVIVEDDLSAPFFAGWHRHGANTNPTPGGIPRAVIPLESPSRAWLKLVQALAFAGLETKGTHPLRGKIAVELGSAPGGASYALLQRGVRVHGIDPGAMDPRVLDYRIPGGSAFTHLQMTAGEVPPHLLPPQADLLISDLNLAPAVMIRLVRKMQAQVHASLLILTLKINDRAVFAGLKENLAAIRDFAPGPVRATQLPGNRDEICVVAGRLG